MNRSVTMLLAGLVAFAAAAVLAWSLTPDTGGDVPAQELPTVAPAVPELPRGARPGAEPPRPEMAALEERRAQDDAVRFGAEGSTWNAVKRDLSAGGLSEEMTASFSALINGLRDARRFPDRVDAVALQAQQDALRQEIVEAGLVDDRIRAHFQRLDDLAAEYPRAGDATD